MRRFWIIGLILMICLGLTSCTQIEDVNGQEDIGLATITKDQLLEQTPSHSSVGSESTRVNDKVTLKVKQFSGVQVLDSVTVPEGAQSVTFAVSCVLEKGNFYIYVYKDGKIVNDLSVGKSASLKLELPAAGKYELRIAGESAAFELTSTITVEQ